MPTIEHFENLLRLWEDACFVCRMGAKLRQALNQPLVQPLEGAILHSAEFRQELLNLRPGNTIRPERFFDTTGVLDQFHPVVHNAPLNLMAWTGCSRRVFRPDRDLQVLLQATSLEGLTLADIPWPFESFAVSLERPLMYEGQSHSLILISTFFSSDNAEEPIALSVTALNDNLLRYVPNPPKLVERLHKRFRQKDWIRAQRVLQELADDYVTRTGSLGPLGSCYRYPWSMLAEQEVVGDLGLVSEQEDGSLDMILEATRLASGLSLYLGMCGADGRRSGSSDWKPSGEPGWLGRAITSGAQVCDVASMHKLSSAEIAALEDAGGCAGSNLVSAYFRRGHWRKKPGEGENPLALKTVWVRPTLVCRDRLPETGLPVGAVTTLKS